MWMHIGRHGRRGGLRYWILSMLRDKALTGAEIMDQVESVTMGWWRPSPGSVYPMLDALVQEGLVRKREDGKYELTADGKAAADWPFGALRRGPRTLEEMIDEMSSYISYFEDLKKANDPRLAAHLDKIRRLSERLSSIVS
ncbi:MAG: PadR family transcriptional regulator [Nitrososphaerota archaeon]